MRVLSALVMALAIATPAVAETVLIRDGRVVTNGAAGIIENGDVLIVDGRISAVGANVAAPRGARIIEARGAFVTPGAFAAMSELGLS
ncbi:MAG TPA: amidohydrolase, partial [Verrucomicrobiae bacterium]|nr:amidohydrolase [Verrucomicrobiae bacterium]